MLFFLPFSKCANITISCPMFQSFQACQQPTPFHGTQLNLENTLQENLALCRIMNGEEMNKYPFFKTYLHPFSFLLHQPGKQIFSYFLKGSSCLWTQKVHTQAESGIKWTFQAIIKVLQPLKDLLDKRNESYQTKNSPQAEIVWVYISSAL